MYVYIYVYLFTHHQAQQLVCQMFMPMSLSVDVSATFVCVGRRHCVEEGGELTSHINQCTACVYLYVFFMCIKVDYL